MYDKFVVTQEHGGNSIVEVHEDVFTDPLGRVVNTLSFYTHQSLVSNSGRAWNVKEAIRRYCLERGYRFTEETQHEIKAVYDPLAHGNYLMDRLKQQIKDDPRYQRALEDGKQRAKEVQSTYGPVIAQLNLLIHALQRQANARFSDIAGDVGDVQDIVLTDLDAPIPPHLIQDHMFKPLYQPTFDHYARYKVEPEIPEKNLIQSLLD